MRLVLLVFALVALAGCGSGDGTDSATSAGGDQLEITETEFALDPDTATVDASGETTIRVVNNGAMTHALEIEGNEVEEETEDIAPGESGELTVDLGEGEYEIYCPIGNHRDQGMEGTLVVSAGAAGGTETGETDTGEDGGYYGG